MLSAILLTLAQSAAPATGPAAIPPLEEAREQIATNDAELFWAAFEGCEPRAIEDLLTEDFRMLHDLAGLAVRNRDAFLESMAEQCAARLPGGANEGYKNRRLLVPGTRQVTPLGDWGVLERGYHTFHEWQGEELGWVQTGGARYIHVWRWMPDEARFRLQESISVDHGAMEPYPSFEE